MSKIFISYRRGDSADLAGRIDDRLVARFGRDEVFFDTNAIPPGTQFPEHIRKHIAESRLVLALIGESWLDVRDGQNNRRLNDPADYVRQEIEQALGQKYTKVIPVQIKSAAMPKQDQLPTTIRRLATINALPVRLDPDFHGDLDRLVRAACDALGWRYEIAPAGLVLAARIFALAFAAAMLAAVAWWINGNVFGLEFATISIATWPVGFGVAVGVYWLGLPSSRSRLARATLVVTAIALASLWPFISTWGRSVVYVSEEKLWFLIADKFNADMCKPSMAGLLPRYAAHPEQALSESGFVPDRIYDPAALAVNASWLQMSYLLATGCWMAVVALLVAFL